jgi:hypothetical protein
MFGISLERMPSRVENDMSSSLSKQKIENTSNSSLNWMENNIVMNQLEGNISDHQIDKNNQTNGLSVDKEWDTLDEPIIDTLLRDLTSISKQLLLNYMIIVLIIVLFL